MGDEADDLSNFCTDFVSLRSWEPAVQSLFIDRTPGVWVPFGEICDNSPGVADSLLVAWMASPAGEPGYSVIVFHDPVLKWSMTADYNSARLLSTAMNPAVALAG